MEHIVAVSGGKDSTALAFRLAEVEPRDYVYLITPTGNELPAMVDHWRKLETLLGRPFVRLKESQGPDGLAELIEFFGALPSHRMRWCTRMLKIEPTLDHLKAHAPCVQYVGLRADEETRGGIYGDVPGVEQRYPFREWGWGVEDVRHYLHSRGVEVPERTDCAWCYDQRLVEWYRLWLRHPDLYHQAEEWEGKIGHTFRSPGRDTWPARLVDLRATFEAGRRPKGWERQATLFADPGRKRCRICTL
jgi:hypothetical protein